MVKPWVVRYGTINIIQDRTQPRCEATSFRLLSPAALGSGDGRPHGAWDAPAFPGCHVALSSSTTATSAVRNGLVQPVKTRASFRRDETRQAKMLGE